MIKIGSLFSGIGGFELGLERAIPGSSSIWQVEQNKYCQQVLKKHWPDSIIYDDVRTVGKHNLQQVDIICGGFPCQDISTAGKKGGIHAKRSGLWWEMFRIIGELRPRVAVLENVPNLITLGMSEVLGSLASIGYDSEWSIISAKEFGAPHLRKRVFVVAYSNSDRSRQTRNGGIDSEFDISPRGKKIQQGRSQKQNISDTYGSFSQRNRISFRMEKKKLHTNNSFYHTGSTYWEETEAPSPICGMDDGIPNRLDKLRAIGNSIVPQCSEWIGGKIWASGILGAE